MSSATPKKERITMSYRTLSDDQQRAIDALVAEFGDAGVSPPREDTGIVTVAHQYGDQAWHVDQGGRVREMRRPDAPWLDAEQMLVAR